MLTWLSRHIAFPLWDVKDRAHRREYLRALTESQWEDSAMWRERQWLQLQSAVKYAFENCSYYRDRFSGSGFRGTLADWEAFRSLPVLTKADIRRNAEGLISKEFKRDELVEARTGGSTGTALTLYFDRRCQELRNAAAMRSDRWAGWDIGMKVAAVWGNPPVATTIKQKLRSMLLDRTFYLDTMDISESSVREFVAAWRSERPEVLFGHSHSIYILATYLRDMAITDLRPRGIVSTSMMLIEPERRCIEQIFQCPCTNRYGCEEVGLIACECELHDGLHLNVDHLVVEFLNDDGTETRNGYEGNIVVTDLVNLGMPLIRYKVEDMGVPSARLCSCGRGLPLMDRVTGRRADFLKRMDGSLVAGVSLVERTLTAIPGIAQMQLIQDEVHRIRAKIVADEAYTDQTRRRLQSELEEAFGYEVSIEIELVELLDRTPSGKYRFAVCNV